MSTDVVPTAGTASMGTNRGRERNEKMKRREKKKKKHK